MKNADTQNTIEKEEFLEYTKSVCNMQTASATEVGHPAPFPKELPYRAIQLYSFKNDVVLDPFVGSGTTALVAEENDRNFVGYDIHKEYVELSRDRIRSQSEE